MKKHHEHAERSRQKKKHYHQKRINHNEYNRRGKKQFRDFPPKKSVQEINRSEVCPFLVRIFYIINDINQYTKVENLPKNRQLRLYLWMNVTLKQLIELVRAHMPLVRTKQRFVVSRVKGHNDNLKKEEMGVVMVHKKNQGCEEKTLEETGFQIGDYIDLSINYK